MCQIGHLLRRRPTLRLRNTNWIDLATIIGTVDTIDFLIIFRFSFRDAHNVIQTDIKWHSSGCISISFCFYFSTVFHFFLLCFGNKKCTFIAYKYKRQTETNFGFFLLSIGSRVTSTSKTKSHNNYDRVHSMHMPLSMRTVCIVQRMLHVTNPEVWNTLNIYLFISFFLFSFFCFGLLGCARNDSHWAKEIEIT